MLDEDTVIVSEKDFALSPSPSPVPSADDDADRADTLNSSAVVSDDDEEGGAEIVPAAGAPGAEGEGGPTAEDVASADKLALSISPPPPAAVAPSARQIVSIGTESDAYEFAFHEEELNGILAKVPAGWKVCVVSVVGVSGPSRAGVPSRVPRPPLTRLAVLHLQAFRTGKSFLLSWFLRYLESHNVGPGGKKSAPDDDADGRQWFERVKTLNQKDGSFDWRGGTERNTTGMWMWSDPYFLPGPSGDVAVLLVDTQGMFDHETTVCGAVQLFPLRATSIVVLENLVRLSG